MLTDRQRQKARLSRVGACNGVRGGALTHPKWYMGALPQLFRNLTLKYEQVEDNSNSSRIVL